MIKTLTFIISACFSLVSFAQITPKLKKDNIDAVVKAKTLEEKVQMCCGVGTFFRDNGKGIAGALVV